MWDVFHMVPWGCYMYKAFLQEWRGETLNDFMGEKVIGGKDNFEGCFNPGGHHGSVVFCRTENQIKLISNQCWHMIQLAHGTLAHSLHLKTAYT